MHAAGDDPGRQCNIVRLSGLRRTLEHTVREREYALRRQQAVARSHRTTQKRPGPRQVAPVFPGALELPWTAYSPNRQERWFSALCFRPKKILGCSILLEI